MAPKPDRLAIIFGMVAKLFAKATTKLGLATTIAALWLTAVPIAGAVADGVPISAARAAAIHECNLLPHDIRYTTGVTPKSICIGPAWPDMANKNDWQSANAAGSIKARLSRWRTDHEKARYAWDYRWGRNIDCGAALASMVAKECDAIACQR
jgi:hypothetical protein